MRHSVLRDFDGRLHAGGAGVWKGIRGGISVDGGGADPVEDGDRGLASWPSHPVKGEAKKPSSPAPIVLEAA